MTGERYNIELTEEDAELFKIFLKYYEVIKVILNSHALDVINGSAVLYFNARGVLMRIEVKQNTYINKPA